MDFYATDRNPLQRYGGIGAVTLLHVLAAYALVTGLARRMIETIKQPVEVKMIEEVKPPPPEERLVPLPKLNRPPPPFIPPPEVPVAQPPDINPIAAPSHEPPKDRAFQKEPETRAPTGPAAVQLEQKGRAKADWDSCMPHYPPSSLSFEEEGTTRIRFEVGADSKLQSAALVKSSGFARLDKAALKALSQCAFRPAVRDGKPVESTLTVDFVWSLSGGGWQ